MGAVIAVALVRPRGPHRHRLGPGGACRSVTELSVWAVTTPPGNGKDEPALPAWGPGWAPGATCRVRPTGDEPSEDSGRGCQWVLARHRDVGPALRQATGVVRARLGVARGAPATRSRGTRRCLAVITATRGSQDVSESDEIRGGRQGPLWPQPGGHISPPPELSSGVDFPAGGSGGGDARARRQGAPPGPPCPLEDGAAADPSSWWRPRVDLALGAEGRQAPGDPGRGRALGRPECPLGRGRRCREDSGQLAGWASVTLAAGSPGLEP